MSKYYVELARNSLDKAKAELRRTEEYLVRSGGDVSHVLPQISKLISAIENRNKELGIILPHCMD